MNMLISQESRKQKYFQVRMHPGLCENCQNCVLFWVRKRLEERGGCLDFVTNARKPN